MHVAVALLLACVLIQTTGPAPGSLDGARAAAVELLALNAKKELGSERGVALRTGELKDVGSGTIGALETAPNLVVLTGSDTAVARTSLRRGDGSALDVYLYLTFDGTWRVRALRALALPG